MCQCRTYRAFYRPAFYSPWNDTIALRAHHNLSFAAVIQQLNLSTKIPRHDPVHPCGKEAAVPRAASVRGGGSCGAGRAILGELSARVTAARSTEDPGGRQSALLQARSAVGRRSVFVGAAGQPCCRRVFPGQDGSTASVCVGRSAGSPSAVRADAPANSVIRRRSRSTSRPVSHIAARHYGPDDGR